MDFAIRPEIQELREKVLRFLETRLYPGRRSGCAGRKSTSRPASRTTQEIRALQAEARAMGVWAGHLPKEAGGMGLSVADYGLLNEVIGRAYFAPRVFGSNAPDSGNAEILWHFGTPAQKERFFWPLQRAEVRSFFGMTEPEVSGADPTGLRTTAVRDGGHWVINGHKWYSSNANGAAFGIVMAATEPEAPPHRRYSQILVPADTPGPRARAADLGHGPSQRARATGRCASTTCGCPSRTCSGEPGQGFAIAQARLGPGRIHHCMRWIGQAQRAFELMCAYAQARGTPSAGPSARSRPCRTGSRTARPRSRPPAS